MKILLFGHRIKEKHIPYILTTIDEVRRIEGEIIIFNHLKEELQQWTETNDTVLNFSTWKTHEDIINSEADMMITLGGDGTILKAITYLKDSNIPILGINLGRLGFLAIVRKEKIKEAFDMLQKKMYDIHERTLLQLESHPAIFGEANIALNDFTIHKRDTSSMIIIHTYINGELLNSYWADGLVISTPTGSTGYSLSCGGPIVFPNSDNFVVTPVAPHNLNVRPIVIKDQSVISFEIEGRSQSFLCTLDSRYAQVTSAHQLAIRKCDYKLKLIQLHNFTFMKMIHKKLSWGDDKRNH